MQNSDPQEISKFDAIASHWWDKEGEFRPLHDINPKRLEYIMQHSQSLQHKQVLDVGCGGGILSESMAHYGAKVTAIDLSENALSVARLHLYESQLNIDYQHISAEDLAAKQPHSFDIVTCMEMLEHVPDPAAIIQACAILVKPDGDLYFSTINRNIKAYTLAILGAEYILHLLPKGTHDYAKLIRPSELDKWIRKSGMEMLDVTGIQYNPLLHQCYLSSDIDVNYLVYAKKKALSGNIIND